MLTSVFVGSHAVNECLHRSSLARPIGRFTAPEALLQRARRVVVGDANGTLCRILPPSPSLPLFLLIPASMIRARIMRASLAAQGRRRT